MKKLINKKFMITALSLVLIASLTVTGALASMYADTNSRVNKFTFTLGNVSIEILESLFALDTNDTYVKEINLLQGSDVTVNKDPAVLNTSYNEGIYVAMKLVWVWNDDYAADPEAVMSKADFDVYIKNYVKIEDLNLTDWTEDVSDPAEYYYNAVYYYKELVEAGSASTELFTEFTILKSAVDDADPAGGAGDTIFKKYDAMGGFSIIVYASAVDAASYDAVTGAGAAGTNAADAADDLKGLFDTPNKLSYGSGYPMIDTE